MMYGLYQFYDLELVRYIVYDPQFVSYSFLPMRLRCILFRVVYNVKSVFLLFMVVF
jgi:hypothetical protein